MVEGNTSCESMCDLDLYRENTRVWRTLESVSKKVWESIKELGVEGEEDNKVFEGIIKDMEENDRLSKEGSKEKNNMVPLL